MLYEAVVPTHKRVRYEAGKLPALRVEAFSTPGTRKVRWRYVWALLLVTLGVGLSDYFAQIAETGEGDNFYKYAYYRIVLFVLLRALVLCISTIHVHLRARWWPQPVTTEAASCDSKSTAAAAPEAEEQRSKRPEYKLHRRLSAFALKGLDTSARHRQRPGLLLVLSRLLLSIGSTVGSAFFMYMYVYDKADAFIGFALAPSLMSPESTWASCLLNDNDDNANIRSDLSYLCSQVGRGLSYFISDAEMDSFSREGRPFAQLANFYSDWWQLTYAAYYE